MISVPLRMDYAELSTLPRRCERTLIFLLCVGFFFYSSQSTLGVRLINDFLLLRLGYRILMSWRPNTAPAPSRSIPASYGTGLEADRQSQWTENSRKVKNVILKEFQYINMINNDMRLIKYCFFHQCFDSALRANTSMC